jgi:flagellar assembly factor FliW
LLVSPGEAPFLWLQMDEEPQLAFLVISPAVILESYHPDLSSEDAEFLGLVQAQDAMVFNIVTMHQDGSATVNLKGPIVVNRQTLTGKQVIPLNAAEFSLQHPLPVAK